MSNNKKVVVQGGRRMGKSIIHQQLYESLVASVTYDKMKLLWGDSSHLFYEEWNFASLPNEKS